MKYSIVYDEIKRGSGKEYRKCFICGLSTSLNIHDKCGTKKDFPDASFDERECVNLDCKKMFTPNIIFLKNIYFQNFVKSN